MFPGRNLQKIFIEKSARDEILARNIQERAPRDASVEFVDDAREVIETYRRVGRREGEKEALLVYNYPGRFLSSCPGSDGMVCCNYFVINIGVGCVYDCHYCYLQSFMNNPLMTFHANLGDMLAETRARTQNKNYQFRIGTGEYTDSLALEELTGLSSFLVREFAGMENAMLELKTKSDQVDALLDLVHRGKTVISFSINPPEIISRVEEYTSPLEARLEAAERALRAGYKLAFHLDPVIYYEGWEKDYHELIDEVLDRIHPDRIVWISLGGFRYSPGLKEIIQARFPLDELTRSEMFQGPDGKYRYFKTIRREMYRSLRRKIEARDPRLFLYLCMETRRMWEEVFDFVPHSAKILDRKFEERRLYVDSLQATSDL